MNAHHNNSGHVTLSFCLFRRLHLHPPVNFDFSANARTLTSLISFLSLSLSSKSAFYRVFFAPSHSCPSPITFNRTHSFEISWRYLNLRWPFTLTRLLLLLVRRPPPLFCVCASKNRWRRPMFDVCRATTWSKVVPLSSYSKPFRYFIFQVA